jgi:integrase
MGRKRKECDRWMPEKVYRGRAAFEYRPVKSVCIRVAALDAPKPVVIRRALEEFERYHLTGGTVAALIAEFFDSAEFSDLSERTIEDYLIYAKPINKVFGKMDAKKLLPEHVRKYMDLRGKASKTQANRNHSFLSRVYAWGFERGKVSANPCKGVAKFKTAPRDVYISDMEYRTLLEFAPPAVFAAMEISYLCAARQGDVLRLTKAQLLPEGVDIKQGKTGKRQIKEYTPRLSDALKVCSRLGREISSIYVVPNLAGSAYTSDGFRTMFSRARAEARKETGLPMRFTFHDIKAKSISDYEGDKRKFSGHKSEAQVATYNRKVEIVPTLGGEK